MNEQPYDELPRTGQSHLGIYRDGQVHLDAPVDWPSGTHVEVRVAELAQPETAAAVGPAIIAGFGLPGRLAADLFDRYQIDYVVVERNAETVSRQRRLGRRVITGDICDESTLVRAGVRAAGILALTIPVEEAVLRATALARRLNRSIYIIARTVYSSSGLQASKLGASAVVKAEQAVAREFYEKLVRRLAETCVHVDSRGEGFG